MASTLQPNGLRLPGRSEQAAAEGDALPMEAEPD